MNTIQKRFLAFLLLCIPMRIIFALVAKYINNDYLPYLGFLAIMPAIGFSYIFIFGKRKKGGETFGQKIWWDFLRPIHAILLFVSGVLLSLKVKETYLVLLADALMGPLAMLFSQ